MAGFGDQYHGTPPNKDCTVHQMDRFWFEIHKLIPTIFQSAFEPLAKHFTIVSNLSMDIGK